MKTWRVLLMTLAFMLLGGCLVTFTQPMAEHQALPAGLLGKWTSKNSWGEPLNLELSRVGKDQYQAVSYARARPREREAYGFTVTRHDVRWYAWGKVPAAYGGGFTLAGFELDEDHELVVYSLDLEAIGDAAARGLLKGAPLDTEQGPGLAVQSPMAQVFAYLDDPANADAFVEVARYKRPANAKP